jgi:flagellar biosynthetic protein FlhB
VAETESGQERTEEATAKRQEKAREEGQVARSRELNTLLILMGGVGGLILYGGGVAQFLLDDMRVNFTLSREAAFDPQIALNHLWNTTIAAGEALFPLFALLMLAAFVGPIALGGWLFSGKAVMPKGSRIDPLAGLKRMFSVSALVELVKSLAKFLVLAGIGVLIIRSLQQPLVQLGLQELEPAIERALTMSSWAVLGVSAGMALIAAIDVPYQLFEHNRKLKMTKQEVREEMKDTEGKPEVKSRIRQLQRELARRRMMEAVPQADVVITNPEHFSVALRYDPAQRGAPVVVAKGVDNIAMKIREIASAHGVQILPAPTLARAIYFTTELEAEIPAPLYLSVAQVLAYVFQLKAYNKGQGRKPKPLDEFELPPEVRFDAVGRRADAGSAAGD